jgi:protein-export membrane protein SecD
VDIPGVADAETAIAEIGQTALLTFEDEEGGVILSGQDVADAKMQYGSRTQGAAPEYSVSLQFTPEGATAFADATSRLAPDKKKILIVMDGNTEQPISAPTVNEAIPSGEAQITGSFTQAEAEELAALIRAGSLPFTLTRIYSNNVGATLGADSLQTSLFAGFIGILLVLVFMIFAYKASGVAADLALLIYIAIVIMVMSVLEVTLTLPGMAGIVLSIGMAVDANVIIFERLKEELRAGRSLRTSIEYAFSKAFSAIFDGNITTLIAAIVLFWLGTGPVKGFAQTLAVGIVVSMFTALVITRYILKFVTGSGVTNPVLFGLPKGGNANAEEDRA